MYVPDVELHTCSSLSQATELLSHYASQARLIAGGTDVLVDLKTGRVRAGHLVSLDQVRELRGIQLTDGGLRIGAMTTINELTCWLERNGTARPWEETPQNRPPAPADANRKGASGFAPLLEATREMATPQVRNSATVGGNLASAVPCADLPPILIAMQASVTLWSPVGRRRVSLDQFFVGPRQTVLHSDEIVETVDVPTPPARSGAAFARFALRNGNAIAVASVAASLRLGGDDVIEEARVILGAVAPVSKRAAKAEALLVGGHASAQRFEAAADAAAQAAEPISDVRGSAEFRRELVSVLTRRAVRTAMDRALTDKC